MRIIDQRWHPNIRLKQKLKSFLKKKKKFYVFVKFW